MCKHYWVIEPAVDSTSVGRCKFCHEERVFSNNEPVSQEPPRILRGDGLVLLPYRAVPRTRVGHLGSRSYLRDE